MAEKTLLVTLRVTVADLSDEERQRAADEMCITVAEVETLADISAGRLGDMIACALPIEQVQEIVFEGSDEFCQFTEAEFVSAEWEPDPAPVDMPEDRPDAKL